jgi:progressive ankylosis protein
VKHDLNLAHLWRLFVPLALSWLFMALEQPALTRILNGMPDFELTKAALYLLMGLCLFFESPVIDLLATATALGRNGANVAAVRRFSLLMMATTVVTHGVVAFTPLYHWLTVEVLDQSPEVAAVAHTPFMIMTVWASFVGWRRAHQGFMIRAGMTRAIGLGTVLRLVALVGVTLAAATTLEPLVAVALGLVASVVAEAAYIHIVSRTAVAEISLLDSELPTKSTAEIAWFHLPQTATTLVVMLTAPAISRAISAGPDPVANQSAWSMAFALQWLFRSAIYALPELVIANGDERQGRPVLVRFCLIVGLSLSAAMIAVATTPLGALVFQGALAATLAETDRATPALLLCALLPLIGAVASLYRGLLTMSGVTVARLWAIFAGFSAMVLALYLGTKAAWPGVVTASVGLVAGQVAELAVLSISWNRVDRRERLAAAPT